MSAVNKMVKIVLENKKRGYSVAVDGVRKHADDNLAFDCHNLNSNKSTTVVCENGVWCPRFDEVTLCYANGTKVTVTLDDLVVFASAFTKASKSSKKDDYSERIDDHRSGMFTFLDEEEAEEHECSKGF